MSWLDKLLGKKDHTSGSSSDHVIHLVILVRGGTRMKVAGFASKPPEKTPYQLPPSGTAGLNQYEIVGLAKEAERLYGQALSSKTTWDVRSAEVEPWPPVVDITVIAYADGKRRGLQFNDAEKYWLDVQWSSPEAYREICVCAVRERR